jgi:uncharacterized RDD family membrane protein YckC
MAKQRFRDLKQGKIVEPMSKNKKNSQKNRDKRDEKISLLIAENKQKIKAALTDAFMLMMPIMYIVFYLIMEGREDFALHRMLGWLYILAPLILIQTGFMYWGRGQTPGYRNYKIRVVDSKTLEQPPLFALLFRNMLMVLSLITVVGWLMIFFRKDRQGLHDILSQTMVINVGENEG